MAGYDDDVEALVAAVLETQPRGEVVLILSNGAFGGIYARFRDAAGADAL